MSTRVHADRKVKADLVAVSKPKFLQVIQRLISHARLDVMEPIFVPKSVEGYKDIAPDDSRETRKLRA